MYINQKTKANLERLTNWRSNFPTADKFIAWCKKIVEHIKKRQFKEIYGSYFVYCNSYIKNVSEVLKSLNYTLNGFIEFLEENKLIKPNELSIYLID